MPCPFHRSVYKSFWQRIKERLFSKKEAMLDAAYLEAVLSNTVDAIIIASEKGSILLFNDTAIEMFGYSREEALGKNVSILASEPHGSRHDEYIKHYLETGEKKIIGTGREEFARKKDGTLFPINLAVSDVEVMGRHYFVGIVRDISETRQLQAMEKENARISLEIKAKEDLLAEISHDFKTPLHVIEGISEFLMEGVEGTLNPEQKQAIKKISNATEKLLELVKGVLEEAAVKAGYSEDLQQSCKIGSILENCIDFLKPLASKKGIKLYLEESSKDALVKGNHQYLSQVFVNLISNAIKFTDEGEVRVSLDCRGDEVVIQIIDSGYGFEAAEIELLFTSFVRGKDQQKVAKEGTGLGLVIVKKILELHKGTIEVKSTKGKGSVFIVKLPALKVS